MQNCRFCGSRLPDGASFCSYCGRPKVMDLTWSEGELVQTIQQPEERQSDESQAALPDIILPGMLIGEGQAPPAGYVPMVHGTPQMGGVPTVQGTPSTPNASPSEPGLAHGAGPSASPPSSAPSQEPQIQTHPVTRIQPPPHHHTATHHALRPHTRWLQGAASKVVVGTTTKWVILVVAATVVVATSGIAVVQAIPPALALSGSSTVRAGGTLLLHGKGFFPGGSVTFTLDNGLPVSLFNHGPTRATTYSADREASSANAMQMLLAEQSMPQIVANATVSVSAVGTFDATIMVSTSWALGVHTIHATEGFGSRTADLSFKVIATPKLIVQQKNFTASSRDCLAITGSGNLIRGWLCTVTLSTDSGDLSWSASSTNPSDQFTPSKGVVHSNHPESVTIFIPNEPRCSNATFTFVGPTNTVSVSWSCPTH